MSQNQSLQKQWRQQWKVHTRKYEDSDKTCNKMFTTFADLNPQYTTKVYAILAERDAGTKKGDKQYVGVVAKLRKIFQGVDELREILKYFDKTNESLVKIQKLSEGIFGKMDSMKNEMACSYDQLDDLQRKLSSDLQLLDRRIQCFDEQQPEQRPHTTTNIQTKTKNKQNTVHNKQQQEHSQEQDLPKEKIQIIEEKMKQKEAEVEKVEEEIIELGKFLGWHEEDHRDFVTIWNRSQPNKNYFQIQDELVQYFKMYTNEQIIDHMNKHIKQKKLTEKKKFLISQYKELKEQKKAEQVLKLKSNEHEKHLKLMKEEQMRRAEQEQKQMKEKVQMWKKQKEDQKNQEKRRQAEDEQRRKYEQAMQRREDEQRRRQIMQRKREQQQKQRIQKQQKKKQPPRRPQSAISKQTQSRIRQREQQLIREKMQRAIQRKMQEEQLTKKAQRIKEQKMIKFAYVNSKLEEKTTAAKEKEREKFDGKDKKEANTFGGQLLMTGVRAVPEWRQGL